MAMQSEPQLITKTLCTLATSPLRTYFNPRFYGMDYINPEKPTLFVSNHTIYGVIDAPLLVAEVFQKKGFLIRSLGDTAHFSIPFWKELLMFGGAVQGTRENCAQLMKQGKHILVFPGGGREVFKRKGEAYKLIWKNRTGFVTMAIEYGYSILPVAQVGVENTYSILFDANDLLKTPVGTLLKQTGILKKYLRNGDIIPPIARGLGLTMIPRPECLYFSFGPPISTSSYKGQHNNPEALIDLRNKVETALIQEIRKLLHYREQDTNIGLLRRLFMSL